MPCSTINTIHICVITAIFALAMTQVAFGEKYYSTKTCNTFDPASWLIMMGFSVTASLIVHLYKLKKCNTPGERNYAILRAPRDIFVSVVPLFLCVIGGATLAFDDLHCYHPQLRLIFEISVVTQLLMVILILCIYDVRAEDAF